MRLYLWALGGSFVFLLAHIVYLVAGSFFLETGYDDPIFLLTDITRSDQLKLSAFPFGVAFIVGAMILAIRQVGYPDFRSKPYLTLILFNVLTLNFLVASSQAFTNEVPEAFWWQIGAYLIAVLGIQNVTILLIIRQASSWWVTLFVISILSTLNALALYVVLLELFSVQHLATQIYSMAMVCMVVAVMMAVAGSKPVQMKRAATMLALGAAVSLVNTAYSMSTDRVSPNLSPFHAVKFSTTPDIHLISLDGLAPPKLIRKYLSLKKVPYEDVLSAEDVHVFPNAFVSQTPTEASLNSVMRLAHAKFHDGRYRRDYFSGHYDSPVSHVFRNNSYDVTTGSYTSALGMGGRYVSEYFPSPERSFLLSALCLHKAPISYFGVCMLANWADGGGDRRTVKQAQVAKLKSIGRNDRPQFTFYYIELPGHTPGNFRSNDPAQLAAFAQSFYRSSKTANAHVKRVLEIIASRKRPSLVFLFGDHGAFLSKTILQQDDPKYFVQDRYGVAAAILMNKTQCSTKDLYAYEGKGFITIERILAGIIRCLAVDKKAFDGAQGFTEHANFSGYGYD